MNPVTLLLTLRRVMCTPAGRASARFVCPAPGVKQGFIARGARGLIPGAAVLTPVCQLRGPGGVEALMNTVCGADDATALRALDKASAKVQQLQQRKVLPVNGFSAAAIEMGLFRR